jgi:hypothetical protein
VLSVAWTYAWTSIAAISFVVRAAVLRINLRDNRLVRRPEMHASRLMRRIAGAHVRLSLALAFISISNTAVGVAGLVGHYYRLSLNWQRAIGYAFIAYFILSEVVLSVLAVYDLQMRRNWVSGLRRDER